MNVCYDRLGLVGRLGNALYELCATAGIAHTLGVEPRFNADWIHRPYFSVPDHYFVEDWDHNYCTPAAHTSLVAHIDERARIYLQDYNLFAGVLPTLREWLQPSDRAAEIMAADPQVAEFNLLERPVLSVHVRRGDNAPGGDPGTPDKHLYHPMPPLSYYLEAMREFEGEQASVAVFSDDPEWCVANVPGDFYMSGLVRPKEHEKDYLTAPVLDWIDWQLLVRCDAAVVSNSTFGMMAAIISGHEHVVHPWPVYGRKLAFIDASLMMPAHWIRGTT